MRKTVIAAMAVLSLILTSCATIYEAPQMTTRVVKHQKIAFIPFQAIIQYKKLPKGTTVEQIQQMEEEMGYVFQEQMYMRFLKKVHKYNVEFQDVSQTNALLKKNDITYANIAEHTKEELAQMLGVDAVVSGRVLSTKPMSLGGAIAVGVLFGVGTATNKVDVNVSLHDGIDSKLLFKYDHTYSGGIGSSPEDLTEAMMRHIERKFPYRV